MKRVSHGGIDWHLWDNNMQSQRALSHSFFSSQKATECCGAARFKNATLQRMCCSLLCSSVRMPREQNGPCLLACDAVSSHCLPFTYTYNKSQYVDFWKSKWGHKYLLRGAAFRCCASSSVSGACQLSGCTTPDICSTAALYLRISTYFAIGSVPYLTQLLKGRQWKV